MRYDNNREGEDGSGRYDDGLGILTDELDEASPRADRDEEQRPLRLDDVTDDEADLERRLSGTKEEDSKKPIAWRDLPQKQQLVIITLARLSEPLVQTSLQVSPLRNSWGHAR